MRKTKRIAVLLLAVLMMLSCAMPVGAANKYFKDVKEGIWFEEALNAIMDAQAMMGSFNIINGYPESSGGGFQPDNTLRRSEFLKMILEAEMASGMILFTTDTSRDKIHWAGRYYTLALENNLLVADVYSGGGAPMFQCTFEELEKPVTRYEMAVILNNIETNVGMKQTVVVNNPEKHISDYASIPAQYRQAVEQAYGKGLITGFPDRGFAGHESLTRAQGVTVIYRYLFGCEMSDFAETPELEGSGTAAPEGFQSFAQWLQSGHIDAWGKLDAEAKTRLFGNPNKSYFSSAAEAEPYMTKVTIPIWTMDKTGNKFSSTMSVTVHKLVADEIRYIFQEIYDHPERFPIYGGWSVGGARFTDTLRHSWGCAIDINALYNCECNLKSGYLKVTCGYGWWPVGAASNSFAGSMTAPSYYSIGKNPGEYGHSVVEAFAKYGWGWGGNGWSGGLSFDYMHFSVLPSGG